MSEETQEVKIDIDNIRLLSIEDGDALIITLPEQTDNMPAELRGEYIASIQESFENIFQDKQVRVIIIPHGMKVELALTSQLEDKDNDASSETE